MSNQRERDSAARLCSPSFGHVFSAIREALMAEVAWSQKRARQKRNASDYEGDNFYQGRRSGLTIALSVIDRIAATNRESGWISVSERLPDGGRKVLVWYENFGVEPTFAWLSESGQWEEAGGPIIPPTHWHPTPEPPCP
jgi:hypothetical protein